jgi:predicted RNase H-like nuclease (RuvC/YqgF family)
MQIGLLEIIGLVGCTSGVTAFIQWLITANSQRKKEGAVANQEIEKVTQEKANSLEKTGDIYAKLTIHLDQMLDEMREEVADVKTENKEVRAELKSVVDENKVLKQKVTELTKIVEDYKKKCDNCISKA